MKWKCVKDFLMQDQDEPTPFIAGNEYEGHHFMTHDDGTEVYEITNEQGALHCLEAEDLDIFFVEVPGERKL